MSNATLPRLETATPTTTQPESTLIHDAGRYWSAADGNRWVRDMSHWRGQGRWSDDRTWRQWGLSNFARYETLCRLANHPRPLDGMVEWGPGGGCNAAAFAGEARRIYGVDVSAANLAECDRQLRAGGYDAFVPVHIDAADPEAVAKSVVEPVDFFLCTAVYQHFPSQSYGDRITRVAHGLLKRGGVAMIQTRYDDGSETLRCKDSDYEKNAVTFTSYRIDDFWARVGRCGFEPLAVQLLPETRYAYYLLRKA